MKKYKDNFLSSYEDEFYKILSEQLAKEIDREILRGLGLEPERHKRRVSKIKKLFRL